MFAKTKTILQSETMPRVDLEFMNNTHIEEVEMVKQLGKLITEYQESQIHTDSETVRISEGLHAWLEHTKAHFARENELMRYTGFPAFDIHSSEHEIILEEMETVINNWLSNNDIESLSDYIFAHWPAWFKNHVETMDKATAHFALMKGYTDDLQKVS
jgi:hemerythrin